MKGRAILINNNFEIQVKPVRGSSGKITGGVVIGNTLHQNTGLIINAKKGEFKEMPALGAAIEGVLLDDNYGQWQLVLRLQLELDGQTVKDVDFNSINRLKIDSSYQ